MRKFLVLSFAFLLLTLQVVAQTRTVTGVVTDGAGLPQSNVSVQVKNTTTGTTTDNAGNFRLEVPAAARTLEVSAIGFNTLEVDISGKSQLTIQLSTSNQNMDEVVVVAYGTQKRESITGSVSTITAKQLEGRMVTNFTQALAGAAPGIQATSGNGQPGSSAATRVRGFGSLNASSSPLYVVDGFPYEGGLADINVNDIESITVLKDAAASALYGARAANGVILLTTKRGKTAQPRVSINYAAGYSERGIPEYDRVGTLDYYPVMWQALKNSLVYPSSGTGLSPSAGAAQASAQIAGQLIYNPFDVPAGSIVGTDGRLNPAARLLYDDFDWYRPLSRKGPRHEFNMSTSARINKSDYFVSFNYLKDAGFVLKSDFERASVRLNLNTEVKSWLRSGINLSTVFVRGNQGRSTADDVNSIVNPFVFARDIGPIYPVHAYTNTGAPVLDANGNPMFDYGQHTGAVNRPQGAFPGRHVLYETMLNEYITTRNSIIGRTFLEARFLQHFTATANLGIDLNNSRARIFQNKVVGDGVTNNGTATRSSNEARTISMNQILNYTNQFGAHDLSVLAGHENNWVDNIFLGAGRRGMNLDGNLELINFVTLSSATGSTSQLRREGYFSKVNYGYDGKYFADFMYRRDGSSRFAPESRWGNFYSAGASWFIKREDFMAPAEWLSDLKIRASYGVVGNEELDTYYEYQALYNLGSAWNNATEPGAIAAKLYNPDLTWEGSKTLSLGVDFGIFKNRITGTLEAFDRGSSRLLFDVPQGLTSVVTTRTENIGTMSNRGLELQLNADLLRTKDLAWDVRLNATTLKNVITKLPGGQPITSGTKRLEEGRDLYAFYLRKWYGVDSSDGAALYYAVPGLTSGYRISKSGDTLVTNPTNARYDYAGSAIPKFFGSFTTNLQYKGFGLSVLLNYQIGGKFYDVVYQSMLSPSYGSALHADVLHSWKSPGDITDIPRLDIASTGNLNAASDRFLIDASYLNVRNASLMYTFGSKVLTPLRLSLLRVYVSGENLVLFSKRKGMNPAESFTGTNDNVYVPNRVLSAGINLTF